MKFNCPTCDRWYDLPTEPGDYACETCGRKYHISRTSTPPAVTHHCPGCEAAARELADLKSDKAWADKLSAENADELSNLRREHEELRAGILRVIEDYPRAIKQDAEEALRTLADGVAAPVSSNSDLRARLAALLSARTPPYVSEIECNAYARGRADVLEELRALLAETEAK